MEARDRLRYKVWQSEADSGELRISQRRGYRRGRRKRKDKNLSHVIQESRDEERRLNDIDPETHHGVQLRKCNVDQAQRGRSMK